MGVVFFFQAEDGIRDVAVTGVQTCALPILAPKDGTALGVVVESAALEQALANPAALYDAAKFTWIGRVATSNNIFMQWHTSKVQSIADSRRLESSLAGTGPGSIAETVPRLLNALAGTKFN